MSPGKPNIQALSRDKTSKADREGWSSALGVACRGRGSKMAEANWLTNAAERGRKMRAEELLLDHFLKPYVSYTRVHNYQLLLK